MYTNNLKKKLLSAAIGLIILFSLCNLFSGPTNAQSITGDTITLTPSGSAFAGQLVQFSVSNFTLPPIPIGAVIVEFFAHIYINSIPFKDVPASYSDGILKGSFQMPNNFPGTKYIINITASEIYQYMRTLAIQHPLYGITYALTWGAQTIPPSVPNHFQILVNFTAPPLGWMGTFAIYTTGPHALRNAVGSPYPYIVYLDSFPNPTLTNNGSATYTIESQSGANYWVSTDTVNVSVPIIPTGNTTLRGPPIALTGFYDIYTAATFVGTGHLEGFASASLILVQPPQLPLPLLLYILLIILLILAVISIVLASIILRNVKNFQKNVKP